MPVTSRVDEEEEWQLVDRAGNTMPVPKDANPETKAKETQDTKTSAVKAHTFNPFNKVVALSDTPFTIIETRSTREKAREATEDRLIKAAAVERLLKARYELNKEVNEIKVKRALEKAKSASEDKA